MGRYESKEKTRKRRIEKLKESVLECLIVLLGVVVVTLLGLPDDLFDGQGAYAIGLLVLFLISLAGYVIHKLIQKKEKQRTISATRRKSLPCLKRGGPRSGSEGFLAQRATCRCAA